MVRKYCGEGIDRGVISIRGRRPERGGGTASRTVDLSAFAATFAFKYCCTSQQYAVSRKDCFELIREELAVTPGDRMCEQCTSLLIYTDKLENALKNVKVFLF